MLRRRKVTLVAVGALTVALVLAVVLAGRGGSTTAVPSTLPGELTGPAPWPRNVAQLRPRLAALDLPALAFEGTRLHIHQHLDLYVLGRRVVVPAGVGIDGAGAFISPLHTHDTSGVIHVESPTIRPFTLGEFFGVWGVPLRRASQVYVDGRRVSGDPAGVRLTPHEEIVVLFGSRRPRTIPTSYRFPFGL